MAVVLTAFPALAFCLAIVIAKMCDAVFFHHSAVPRQSGNCGLSLNIWQYVIKKDEGSVIHATSLEASRQ